VPNVSSVEPKALVHMRDINPLCKFGSLVTTRALRSDALSAAAAARGSSLSDDSSPKDHTSPPKDPNAPTLLQHAHEYGYSNSDSLNSMGLLSKVRLRLMRFG
jgi:hypothetical protein